MKSWSVLFILLVLLSCSESPNQKKEVEKNLKSQYTQNRSPLNPNPYLELPLGAIKAEGWLEEQLKRMASGMTGNLDNIYPTVVGDRNGWLGGDGDGWERGPYWIDGLLPLAYILDDETLKKKAGKWVDWTLSNQGSDGYIGPVPFSQEPKAEPGLQKGMRKDWWPKMVMLKILQQYYNATQDERVIKTLTEYFKYQLKELPKRPLDDLSFWGNRRGADNLQVVYWLYNITGDVFLLELGDIIKKQTFPWEDVFLNDDAPQTDETAAFDYFRMKGYPFDTNEINNTSIAQIGTIHTVNLAQGLKAPIIYYQKEKDPKYLASVKKALEDMEKYHGQAQGMYGGDEPLHGTDPVQGIEFCSVSEEMFSLESILKITGDMEFADLLEKITYNALPSQASDNYDSRQYFQAANQVELTDKIETSFQTKEHGGTDFVFGEVTGYPCCTTNMHQSWPKFVQNLFYATPEGGVAALLYAPSTAKLKVSDNVDLTISETTGFPFRETVDFNLRLSNETYFPFHFRIPSWADKASISLNGEVIEVNIKNNIAIIERLWKDGDNISLKLPMKLKTSKWHKGSAAIERGPLIYALKVNAEVKKKNRNDGYREFSELYPTDKWNYGLIKSNVENIENTIEVVENDWDGSYPWNLENAPIQLRTKAVVIPDWKLDNSAPIFPEFPDGYKFNSESNAIEEITLIPYGCTTLRITQFPTYDME